MARSEITTGAVGVDAFVRSIYRPYNTLAQQIESIMLALMARFELRHASIWLRGFGTLRLIHDGASAVCNWVGDEPADAEQDLGTGHGRFRFPLIYARKQLGELRLQEWSEAVGSDACEVWGSQLARRCAFLYMRYEMQHWSRQRLRRALLLVGASERLHEVELFVEKASHSMLPVLLTGEFGTEKTLLAAALHCCGPRRDGPFVEINCSDPSGEPDQWFRMAAGGTLFFNGIDELAPRLQGQLPQHMHSRLGQWLAAPDAAEVRVVATATSDLRQGVEAGRFSRPLLAELDFLSVTVPPLRVRQDDIAPLVMAALEHHGHAAQHDTLEALIGVCTRYTWPENLFELERVIARLAVMTDGKTIDHADIARHVPWIARPDGPVEAAAQRRHTEPAGGEIGADGSPPEAGGPTGAPSHWARCALTREGLESHHLHKALRRALGYLGEHYATPISMDELARHAHVSPSHLSHLFRHSLDTAFKPLLQCIRIEKSKELLTHGAGMRITDVALSVGFGDLSHFEKSFRRMVGMSPREFRHADAGSIWILRT
ncbi:Transcriptional regulator [Burkholderia gladioli]|nr:Nitrogen assimilation regulatory protein [Burkholderia gladioli]CAG9235140.1 Transcriptional regulator [Burkholderia gladioli]